MAKQMITKTVKFPLVVTLTAEAADAKGAVGAMLIERLAAKLPMKIRLGRGRKETIAVDLKPAKA